MRPRRLADGLVFGGSSGVGAAVARRLSRDRRLVAAARRPAEPPAAEAARILPRRCDVRRYDEVEALFLDAGGEPLDFVVNCAGVGYYAPLTDDYSTFWQRTLETNVLGLLHIASNLLRHQPRCGCFVQVGSLASRHGSRTIGNVAYTASKVAAAPILDQLRLDLLAVESPTRVILVSPGYIAGTGFGDRFFESAPERSTDLFAGSSSLSADQVAKAIHELVDGGDPDVEVEELVLRSRAAVPAPSLASARGSL